MDEVLFHGEGFELPLMQSALLPPGFRHGFTTRRGGVSGPPFDSMNLGGRWGDAPSHVAENRRRLQVAAGGAIFFANQVHGVAGAWAGPGVAVADVARMDADAVITPERGKAVGVYVADCVPVLIADARSGSCAAVHAGWRGTVAGVVQATLDRMMAEGSRPEDLRVAIGPSIGPCCFQVGAEVVAAVEASFPGARAAGAIIERAPRPHVDLWQLNKLAARSRGVPEPAIDVGGHCTSCQREQFFSYRRDGGATGQLAAFIVRD